MNAAEIRELAIERLAGTFGDVRSEKGREAARALVTPYVDALGDLLPTHSYDEVCGGFQYGAGYTLGEHPPTFTARRYSGTASLDELTIEELLQISSGEAR